MTTPSVEPRSLADALPVAVFRADGHGRLLSVNRKWCDLTGRAAPGEGDVDWLSIIDEEDRAAAAAAFAVARDADRPFSLDVRLCGPTSRGRWAEVHLAPSGDPPIWTGAVIEATAARIAERCLREITVATAGVTGVEFFRTLVRHVARALDSRCALVSEIPERSCDRAWVLAMWADDDYVEPFGYELAGTPCADVRSNGGNVCFIETDVVAAYPTDSMLADMGAEAYLGTPLVSRTGEVLGLLAVIDDRPMHDREHAVELLRIFATEAGAELERLRAEEALRESEERFRLLAENVPAIIYIREGEGERRLLYVSDKVEEQLGVPSKEFLAGRVGMGDLLHPEDASWVPRAVDAALENERPFHLVYRLRHRDGSWRWFEEHGAGVFHDGRLHLLEGFVSDVTDRKHAEEEIREGFSRYRAMFEENWAIKLVLSPEDGAILDANEAACEFYGAPRETLKGMSIDAIDPGCRDPSAAPPHFEAQHRLLSGEMRDVEVWCGPLVIEGRRVLFAIIQDTTERRRLEAEQQRLEERVRQAQKLESLGVLAGGIAHDFNNLLVGILGNTGLAQSEVEEESSTRHLLDEIERAALRASELSKQMLAYSGKGHFVVRALDLNALVEELAHLLEASVSKKATLELDFTPGLSAIVADPTQVRQVVMNLITNASDALADEEGVVSIRTAGITLEEATELDPTGTLEPGPYVVLEVKDTGYGMDEETRNRIFDPFFSTKFTGRGLGLAAVLGIVRGHRGGIAIETAPERGTTIQVYLPAADHAEPEPEPAAPSRPSVPAPRGEGVVLVVDDEEAVRRTARACLERQGFEVLLASDGREAIRVYEEHRDEIRVVLLDMTMPLLGGEETFRALRRLRADLPIVLTSGYAAPDLLRSATHDGPATFIQKPYRAADLVDTLLEVL